MFYIISWDLPDSPSRWLHSTWRAPFHFSFFFFFFYLKVNSWKKEAFWPLTWDSDLSASSPDTVLRWGWSCADLAGDSWHLMSVALKTSGQEVMREQLWHKGMLHWLMAWQNRACPLSGWRMKGTCRLLPQRLQLIKMIDSDYHGYLAIKLSNAINMLSARFGTQKDIRDLQWLANDLNWCRFNGKPAASS